ncbi:major facilitator superfamily domain-containing protein [Pisolithus marmoratus]|nr:major facilitator superfamily domain-containing protein [Pisolithus marmoratus]
MVAPHVVGATFTQNIPTPDANNPSYLSVPNIIYPSTIPGYEEDKQSRQKCTSDPEVQATVAKLSATLTTTMGILSCLTTGWWANFSDRYGRRPVLTASIVGLLLMELTFLITASFVDYLPGGYWFLLTGFIIEGLLGSLPTGVAANHAYMADTCEPSARSEVFSFALGLMFSGFAVGPLLGGFLIHLTGSTLSAFFMAASLHLAYALFLMFVLPESVTEVKARAARLRYRQEKEQDMAFSPLRRVYKEATRFLSALAVLLPRDVVDGNPLKRSKKDWNLFLLAMSYGLATSLIGSMPFLIQYAVGAFRWSSETKVSASHTPAATDETPEATPFHRSPSSLRSRSRSHQRPTRHSLSRSLTNQNSPHSFNVDLILARCAIGLEILACWVMATATSGAVFTVGTMVGALSVAYSPTIQALALEVYYSGGNNGTAARGGQVGMGRLFGALSVLQALGSQIITPAVYGFVYSRTVATFPQAIMLVTAFCFTAALVSLAFVRVPESSSGPVHSSLNTEEGGGGVRNEDSAEGLDEYEGNSLTTDEDEDENHAQEVASWKKRPWWKRPSPYWIACGMLISAIGSAATLAPRVEVYTILVCHTLRPEYFLGSPINMVVPHVVGAAPTQSISATDANNLSYLSSRQRCTSDPEVQATVAKLSATLITTMGILSCLTTGWWANFSDRHGRRPVLTVAITGLLLLELTFLITANFVDYLPGGYWFLLTGFIVEGLLGSLPTTVAANHAYMADTREPSARSQIFAFALGLMFSGFAVGPLLGGFLIHLTGSTLSVFFMSGSLHLAYALVLVFILPESLTEAKARAARLRYKQEQEQDMTFSTLRRVYKEATRSLSTLAVLLPRDVADGNPLKRSKKDWNLFLLAMAYGLATSLMGSKPFLIQYGVGAFHWSSETANYYFSSIGVSRAFVLTILWPLMIKLLKSRKARDSHTPFVEDETPEATPFRQSPLRSRSRSRGRSRSTHPAPSRSLTNQRSMHFVNVDLMLARCAVSVEILACWVMATATSGTVYTLGTMVGSMSVAYSPTIQALALAVYHSGGNNGTAAPAGQVRVGKLFGALSVLQALGSQIIAPAMYGFVYSRTVATFPQAIMLVTASCFTVALVLLAFVRVPESSSGLVHSSRHNEEGGSEENSTEGVLVDVEVQAHE